MTKFKVWLFLFVILTYSSLQLFWLFTGTQAVAGKWTDSDMVQAFRHGEVVGMNALYIQPDSASYDYRVRSETNYIEQLRRCLSTGVNPIVPLSNRGVQQAGPANCSRNFAPILACVYQVWLQCNARRLQHDDCIIAQRDLASLLAATAGTELPKFDAGREPRIDLPANFTTGENTAYGDITVGYGGSVRVDCRSLTAERAVKLVQFLKTL